MSNATTIKLPAKGDKVRGQYHGVPFVGIVRGIESSTCADDVRISIKPTAPLVVYGSDRSVDGVIVHFSRASGYETEGARPSFIEAA